MITELYVPRPRLADFLADAAARLPARTGVDVIYGTVRLIERDDESVPGLGARAVRVRRLQPARRAHGARPGGRSPPPSARLIDLAIGRGGSFYLTYHRFATRAQVEACYPQFEEFLRLKRQYDPEERFQSDWYRHYAVLFGG